MTKTIASQTDARRRYFLTIDETGHATDCTCGDQHYRCHMAGNPVHACKHIRDFNAEVARAATFLALKAAIEAKEREQRYTNYLNWQLMMGL